MPYELRIVIHTNPENGTTTAEAKLDTDRRDQTYGPETIEYDDLRLATIKTLQAWLPRWYAIYAINEQMLVAGTLEVLGRHLYDMLFQGAIEDAFRDALTAAERAEVRLRVLLQFSQASTELARLPWEFLYRESGEKTFLALKTDFMLSRTLAQTTGRLQFRPADPPLRVLVILALPPDRPMADVKSVLQEIGGGDGEETGRTPQLSFSFVEGWNNEELKEALRQDPQVIHFVGHARYRVGTDKTEIELASEDGTYCWRSADSFVSLLQRERQRELPKLVFLHLRDRGDFDFTANFERLAPALIRAKIPLVLAMQYPMPERATRTFLTTLYENLALGEEFDFAVQDARGQMFIGEGDIAPFLGTPVLYMQSESSQLVRPPSGEELTYEPPGVRVSTQPGASQRPLQNVLTQAVMSVAVEDAEDADDLLTWIAQEDWSSDAVRNEAIIRQHMRSGRRFKERSAAYGAMISAVRQASGSAS